MKYTSKLGRQSKNKQSARIILPEAVRKVLEVEIGDTIEWIVTAENNKFKVEVQKEQKE